MKQKERELLVQKVGMQFEEAVVLLSDETLESMAMVNVVGGGNTNYGCSTNNGCTNNGCSTNDGCSGNSGDSDNSGSTDNTGSTGGSGNNSGGSNNTGHGNGNVIVVQWGAAGCQIGWKCSDFSS